MGIFKNDAIANAVFWTFPLGMIISSFVFMRMNPLSPLFWAGFGLILFGFFVLVYAKWPQIREGDLTTFGVPGLPFKNRYAYYISYALMILGFGLVMKSVGITLFV